MYLFIYQNYWKTGYNHILILNKCIYQTDYYQK